MTAIVDNQKTYSKKKYHTLLIIALIAYCTSGCEKLSGSPLQDESNKSDFQNTAIQTMDSQETSVQQSVDPQTTSISIDWSAIDSHVAPVSPDTFAYPFSKDSKAVQAYAEFFSITPSDAQHSLAVGTASNEPLSNLLDQLGDSYVSHELTDGADVKLVITTTPNVTPSTYDYVIENEFAHGLILPIVIQPKVD